MRKIGQEFECYSKRLYGFLTMNGVRYERIFTHKDTGKTCWVYIMSTELSELLIKWKNNRPTN